MSSASNLGHTPIFILCLLSSYSLARQIFENTPHYYSWQVSCQVHTYIYSLRRDFRVEIDLHQDKFSPFQLPSCVLQLPAATDVGFYGLKFFCLRFPELQNWSRLFRGNSWFTPHLARSPSNKLGNRSQCKNSIANTHFLTTRRGIEESGKGSKQTRELCAEYILRFWQPWCATQLKKIASLQ
jgi:hypothetical protein